MVLGGPQETGQLLEEKFDYIFFTGEDEGRPEPTGSSRNGCWKGPSLMGTQVRPPVASMTSRNFLTPPGL